MRPFKMNSCPHMRPWNINGQYLGQAILIEACCFLSKEPLVFA